MLTAFVNWTTSNNFYSGLTAWSTFLAFFTVAGAGLLSWRQLKEMNKARSLAVLLDLYKVYSDPKMRVAISAVADYKEIEDFRTDVKQDQRRMVSYFWHTVGIVCKAKLIEPFLLYGMFIDGPRIWKNLEPLEIDVYTKILQRDNPKASPEAVSQLARDIIIKTHGAAWLHDNWKVERSCLMLDSKD